MTVEKIEEYRQREIRWADKTLNQFGFFNNLLLTLAVGFLAFGYRSISIKELQLTEHFDWQLTSTVGSLLLVGISIIIGLAVAITRLYDFRLTRKINQIRRRMLEHAKAKMDEATPQKFNWIRRGFLLFEVMVDTPDISMEECKSFNGSSTQDKDNIRLRFRELRNITHNLGLKSWQYTIAQILLFGMGIFLYLVGELAK